jgi:RNA polymerase sigma factor (TIGR02999 family)
MPPTASTSVLLKGLRSGDRTAFDELWPRVYDEIRMLAHARLRRHRPGETLNTTALVHEVYLKLTAGDTPAAEDRTHFFALAARAVRFVLISYARERAAAKRGGGLAAITLQEHLVPASRRSADDEAVMLISLDTALDRLAEASPRLARVVELRFFAGMEHAEVAEAMDLSEATVKRDWRRARAWLYHAMQEEHDLNDSISKDDVSPEASHGA